MRPDVLRYSGPIVAYGDEEWEIDTHGRSRNGQPDAMLIGGGEGDLPVLDFGFANGFGRVLYEIEEHLHELVAIAPNRRERGIVELGKADVRREAVLCEPPYMFEHTMNI